MSETVRIYSKPITTEPWHRQRLYPVLVSLQTILHTISPGSTWGLRLHALVESSPYVPLRGMGVPESWFNDPFWSGGHNV